ncbi:MAG: Asp-tRNA(Asn)/Glu-tRNA(Gln) amidotransferase subunit GatC [Candidatus Paceibacterota bacterium]
MISTDEIKKLANLARIKLSEEEVNNLRNEMDSIVGYVEQIQKVSAEVGEREVPENHNVMREDVDPHKSGINTEVLVEAFPKKDGNFNKVKKIL